MLNNTPKLWERSKCNIIEIYLRRNDHDDEI
jgi:hypothetical protein